jgi:undecaprenyl phosphate-alpha-L-ara4N flippase subunit ArnE
MNKQPQLGPSQEVSKATALIDHKSKTGFTWILLSILLQTAAQVFGKQAGLVSYESGLPAIVLNGWYLLELLSLFCQALCWSMALRGFSLSFAYPFMSLVTGLNLLSAWLIFGEPVSTHHVIGISIIMAGVILVSSKAKS